MDELQKLIVILITGSVIVGSIVGVAAAFMSERDRRVLEEEERRKQGTA